MKIGILKETKIPEDNRVAFTPEQLVLISKLYNCEVCVQRSKTRAISDSEYEQYGIKLVDKVSDCDVLFGIKEVAMETLIPNKHYLFFGHLAKMQTYNKPLLQKMMDLNITFTDYEYLVDDNKKRLVAFGWWAGAVGVYNSIRAWGLRNNVFNLEKPNLETTLSKMISNIQGISLPAIKIIVTGNGRVSKGAQYILDQIGIPKLDIAIFKGLKKNNKLCYTVVDIDELVEYKSENSVFDIKQFQENPYLFKSKFMDYATVADMFISCHYWDVDNPVYLSEENLKNNNLSLKVIADITCDIRGSIMSTLRSSTHQEPFYDYNPLTEKEETAFSSDKNITVMAVDTLPNALPKDTSNAFGEQMIRNVLPLLFSENKSAIIANATILKEGLLTEKFSYLKDFVNN